MKLITNDEHSFGRWHQWWHLMKWQCFKLKHLSSLCVQSHHVAAARMYDRLQLHVTKHMECLHDILLKNHVQIICVHAQCDFRNTDDGILQQVNDNREQWNVSPGISSANEQRWFDYSMKIVTQSDYSDEMLLMTTIVPYMSKHEHRWRTRIDWRVTVPLTDNGDVTKHAMMRTVYVSMHTDNDECQSYNSDFRNRDAVDERL